MFFHRQIQNILTKGFERIDATLRLGLGIEDPKERIDELEGQVAELTAKNQQLEDLLAAAGTAQAEPETQPAAPEEQVPEAAEAPAAPAEAPAAPPEAPS